MAKKKEAQEESIMDTASTPVMGLPIADNLADVTSDIFIDKVDFDDLFDLEKAARTTEEQLNRLSGAIFRYIKEQELFFSHEKRLNGEIETKRKDLVKRYRLDEQRQWKIDVNTRKVVYSS